MEARKTESAREGGGPSLLHGRELPRWWVNIENGCVNADTNWLKVTKWRLTGVMTEIVTRIQGFRAKLGLQNRILLENVNVRNAFRQVGIVLNLASVFAYRLEDLLFVDLRLQVG